MNMIDFKEISYVNLEKQKFLIPHITGALSFFGSGWILIEILLDRKKLRMSYHRILFGLSFFDFFSSFGFAMSNWAQSITWYKEPGKYDGEGTVTTCNIVGFMVFLGSLTIPLYSASLTWYYKLTICDGWREERIAKEFEYYVHRVVPSIGIILAIIPLTMQLYNPYYFFCFPCYTDKRGAKYEQFSVILEALSLLIVSFSAIVISYTMTSIIWKVRKNYKKSSRYEFLSPRRKKSCCFLSINYDNSVSDLSSTRRTRRLQARGNKVTIMALLYLVPFHITWVIPFIFFAMSYFSFRLHIQLWGGSTFYAAAQIYIATFLPLQGFLNWFVYIYRRYQYKMLRVAGNTSFLRFFKVIGEVLIRILNLKGTEDDEDCILGSGLEEEVVYTENLEEIELNEAVSPNNNEFSQRELYSEESVHLFSYESKREIKLESSSTSFFDKGYNQGIKITNNPLSSKRSNGQEEENYLTTPNIEMNLEESSMTSFDNESRIENSLEKMMISSSEVEINLEDSCIILPDEENSLGC